MFTLFELYKQYLIIVFDKNYRRLTDVCGVVFYGFATLFYIFNSLIALEFIQIRCLVVPT